VAVRSVTVRDGCLHRFAVRAHAAQTYLLTLYLQAGDATCSGTSAGASRPAKTP
jgi:hypothetical protein